MEKIRLLYTIKLKLFIIDIIKNEYQYFLIKQIYFLSNNIRKYFKKLKKELMINNNKII